MIKQEEKKTLKRIGSNGEDNIKEGTYDCVA